ncbi:hypothetical protein BDC45DRAFT_275473 [Circinella umbellata]|nr:hypothetical protein BDC45DRAFT_275473 [Circinella umbellata]
MMKKKKSLGSFCYNNNHNNNNNNKNRDSATYTKKKKLSVLLLWHNLPFSLFYSHSLFSFTHTRILSFSSLHFAFFLLLFFSHKRSQYKVLIMALGRSHLSNEDDAKRGLLDRYSEDSDAEEIIHHSHQLHVTDNNNDDTHNNTINKLEITDSATATTEYYAQLEVDDSEMGLLPRHSTDRRRLLEDHNNSDDDDMERADTSYRLPSEGGSVFASFVCLFFFFEHKEEGVERMEGGEG